MIDTVAFRKFLTSIVVRGVKSQVRPVTQEAEHDLPALWQALLAAGCNAWIGWLEALPTPSLVGLQMLGETSGRLRDDPTRHPHVTQALLAAGVGSEDAGQLRSDLQCGRDILLGHMTNVASEPSRELLVGELVEAIGPAARRVFGSKKKIDPGTGAAILRQLLQDLVHATKLAKRFKLTLTANMSDVVNACFAAYAPSLQLLALQDTEDVVDAMARPKQSVEAGPRRAHGHYYPCGNGWQTKVVWRGVHMYTKPSQNWAALGDSRASLSAVKAKAEASFQGGKDLMSALEGAVAAERPLCQCPLIWQFSFDTRKNGGKGMTPATPLLEEMLHHWKAVQLASHGEDISNLCSSFRAKHREGIKKIGADEKALAGLRKCLSAEISRRNLAPMLEWLDVEEHEDKSLPAQRRAANVHAADILSKNNSITKAHVEELLNLWGFEENFSRKNVVPRGKSFVYSDSLGAVRTRTGEVHVTQATSMYPDFCRILCTYFLQNCPQHILEHMPRGIPYTSMCINKGYCSKKHRDGNNDGPSGIESFGPHEGGELLYWVDDSGGALSDLAEAEAQELDVHHLAVFDGNKAHATKPYKGAMRYSIVLYTLGAHHQLTSHQRTLLH